MPTCTERAYSGSWKSTTVAIKTRETLATFVRGYYSHCMQNETNIHTARTLRPSTVGALPVAVVATDYAEVGALILAQNQKDVTLFVVGLSLETAYQIVYVAGMNPLAIDPTDLAGAINVIEYQTGEVVFPTYRKEEVIR